MKHWLLEKNTVKCIVGFAPNAPEHLKAEGYTILCESPTHDIDIISLVNGQAVIDSNKVALKEKALADLALKNKWDEMRAERNRRLTATDYTQIPDCPITVELKDAFKAYRQKLREFPQTVTDINTVTWPTKP